MMRQAFINHDRSQSIRGDTYHADIVGDRVMAISGMFSAGSHASIQQAAQLLSLHKRGSHSLTDVDATSSSVASAPSKAGKIGSKIDTTA
jgi:hypothetical protein